MNQTTLSLANLLSYLSTNDLWKWLLTKLTYSLLRVWLLMRNLSLWNGVRGMRKERSSQIRLTTLWVPVKGLFIGRGGAGVSAQGKQQLGSWPFYFEGRQRLAWEMSGSVTAAICKFTSNPHSSPKQWRFVSLFYRRRNWSPNIWTKTYKLFVVQWTGIFHPYLKERQFRKVLQSGGQNWCLGKIKPQALWQHGVGISQGVR